MQARQTSLKTCIPSEFNTDPIRVATNRIATLPREINCKSPCLGTLIPSLSDHDSSSCCRGRSRHATLAGVRSLIDKTTMSVSIKTRQQAGSLACVSQVWVSTAAGRISGGPDHPEDADSNHDCNERHHECDACFRTAVLDPRPLWCNVRCQLVCGRLRVDSRVCGILRVGIVVCGWLRVGSVVSFHGRLRVLLAYDGSHALFRMVLVHGCIDNLFVGCHC